MARLRFEDHVGFHRAALAAMVGGAVGGVAGGVAELGPVAGATVGLAAGLSWAERPWSGADTGLRMAVVAGVVALAATISPAVLPFGLIGALAIGAPRARLVAAAAVAVGAAFVAVWAGHRADAAAALSTWAGPAIDATAGLFVGAVAAAAVAARHVALVKDPVAAVRRGLPTLTGEPAELVARAVAILDQSGAMAPDERALVASGVDAIVAVAARTARTPAVDRAAIDARVAELDRRLAACTDEVAAAQYREARAALADQATYAAAVATAQERVVARMHHCVATLEKFRLACAPRRRHVGGARGGRRAVGGRGVDRSVGGPDRGRGPGAGAGDGRAGGVTPRTETADRAVATMVVGSTAGDPHAHLRPGRRDPRRLRTVRAAGRRR
jgi:hypothetical protein